MLIRLITMLGVKRILTSYYLVIILYWCLSPGCSSVRIVRNFYEPSRIGSDSLSGQKVKLHMHDGSLYLLESLVTTVNQDTIWGYGSYYNKYHDLVITDKKTNDNNLHQAYCILLKDISLIETNRIEGYNGKILGMILAGVPTALVTTFCILNPKACFGSCPTFYCWNGNDTVLMAEGFSSSILPSFEKEDIDMLYHAKITDNKFRIRLTNEALETHVIKKADLLVFSRKNNERIFSCNDGSFVKVTEIHKPSLCKAPEGDFLKDVQEMDRIERYSETDNNNLAGKESLEIVFDSMPDGEKGLIIGARQTFLTTFLFYQSLAFLGHSAGSFAADIERGDKVLRKRVDKIWSLLGGIEVLVEDNKGNWIKAGQYDEMGPIATDVHLIRLPSHKGSSVKIKLVLTKGLWRINYLAMAKIGEEVTPLRIKPEIKCPDNKDDSLYRIIHSYDTTKILVTLPGDIYYLEYNLPDQNENHEIFLDSRGYYIEWMRESWLHEENHRKAMLMFGFPGLYLKKAAKEFKVVEPSMEESFWKSRYVKKD